MNVIETTVAEHYGKTGLLDRILAGLKASGADPERLQPDDLAPVEEFHIGGRTATAHALAAMSLTGREHVLDIGCGIGGTARYISGQTGCKVTGIDLTPEYIATAEALTKLTGQEDKVRYETASALAADIQRHLGDEPVLACPPTAVYRFQKFARRNRTLLAGLSATAVALLVG